MKHSENNVFNTETNTDTCFIDKISAKYLPIAKDLNTKVEDIFKEVNKIAEDNIRYIFNIISSKEFGGLVDELEPIIIFSGVMYPLQSHKKAEQLKKQSEDFMKLPITKYYWNCLSLYYKGWMEVKVGHGYIEIEGVQYYSLAQLYQSEYRLFFVDFGQPQFREAIKNYLRKVGVINE